MHAKKLGGGFSPPSPHLSTSLNYVRIDVACNTHRLILSQQSCGLFKTDGIKPLKCTVMETGASHIGSYSTVLCKLGWDVQC